MTWLFFLLLSSLYGETLDSLLVQKLSYARNSAEVERLQSLATDIHTEKLACKLQLQSHQIPSACFRAVRLETAFGLKRSNEELNKVAADLDRRCVKAVQHLKNFSGIPEKELSPACRHSVVKAQELLAYKLESQ